MGSARTGYTSKDLNMNKTNINSMNEAEKRLFAIFVAELMKNKILTEEDWLDEDEALGEYKIKDKKGMVEIGPIEYDPSKADPQVIRENVLEKRNDKNKRK